MSDHRTAIGSARRIAEALVSSETEERVLVEMGRAMLTTLILHVSTAAEYEGRRTVETACELIRGAATAGEGDQPLPATVLWEAVRQNEACGGFIARYGTIFADLARRAPSQIRYASQLVTKLIAGGAQRRAAASAKLRDEVRRWSAEASQVATIRQEVGNLHDAFMNASLMHSLMLKEPLEEEAAAFMMSNRGRLERSWVAYLFVLVEAWMKRSATPARQWIGSVVSLRELAKLLREGRKSGALKAMEDTRHYMSHRDKRGYWDAGRFGPLGHHEFVSKLHDEFSRIFVAVTNETPPDAVNVENAGDA